jgi:hypothetical protein
MQWRTGTTPHLMHHQMLFGTGTGTGTACVRSVKQSCLMLQVGHSLCSGRQQIFLPTGFASHELCAYTVINNCTRWLPAAVLRHSTLTPKETTHPANLSKLSIQQIGNGLKQAEGISLPSPEDGNRYSFWNVMFSTYLEFWRTDKVHEPSDSYCYMSWSQPFRFYLPLLSYDIRRLFLSLHTPFEIPRTVVVLSNRMDWQCIPEGMR